MLELILALIILLVVLEFYIVIPAEMAGIRGRGRVTWVLISLFISPILAIPLLLILGDAFERREGVGD